jgi:hypothetical protein
MSGYNAGDDSYGSDEGYGSSLGAAYGGDSYDLGASSPYGGSAYGEDSYEAPAASYGGEAGGYGLPDYKKK